MELRSALPTSVVLGGILGILTVATSPPDAKIDLVFGSSLRVPGPAPKPAPKPLNREPAVRWDIPVIRNEPVTKFVRLLGVTQWDRMALYLRRSGRYEGMIRAKLRERGMPEDLVYLSMIESGFNPTARSHAQAVGLWQFMAETGRRYGLRIDRYVDERRDPEKSTDAALRYLRDLHDRFGSWYLAVAAYNTGENRVARIMREVTGSERGSDRDFWRIRPHLPAETREFVPLVVAAALVGKEPVRYGLEDVERWLPVPTETVPVPGGTPLEQIARAVGLSERQLRMLNTELITRTTPPGATYSIEVPEGRGWLFAARQVRHQEPAQAD